VPTSGSVRVDDRPITDRTPRQLKALRADIGFVHQDLRLVPSLRVAHNVLAGRLGRMGFWTSLHTMARPRRGQLLEVQRLLDRVGIPDKIFQRTADLSGGQRQRAAIARALYQEARALLVDEPVSSLDPTRSRDTIGLLTSISRERGLTLVASMHDLALAQEFFPRLVGLRRGAVQFDRPASEVRESELLELYHLEAEEMLEDGT
jgi:phosphonate transport system ATP-binding protein